MASYITVTEAAQRLGVSTADVKRLVDQEILRPAKEDAAGYFFDPGDIDRIASNHDPSLSEEAAQVGIQIQQEVAHSVSVLQQLRRRVALVFGLTAAVLVLSVLLVAALFKFYPQQTSDFFGYYYRFNASNKAELFDAGTPQFGTFAAAATPSQTDTDVSLVASLVKPIAATSLLLVKATDNQQYTQIVQPPATGSPGPPGSAGGQGQSGLNGVNGLNGLNGQPGLSGHDGQPGVQGVAGATGAAGADGINGVNGLNGTDGIDGIDGANGLDGVSGMNGINGTNGLNGTSVADVTTSPGDMIIRDASGVTTRLGAGAYGQVLTIVGGIPAWANASGLTAETDTLASVTARGASTSATLTLSSAANDITAGTLRIGGSTISTLGGSGLSVTGGALNVSGLTNANLSGAADISNANLQYSSVLINTAGPLTGGGSVNLGGPALTLSCATCLTGGADLLTVSSTTGPNSLIAQGSTFKLAGGLNVTAVNDGAGTVTLATSSTPAFTTVNGLTIIANGSNSLSIAAGKSLGVNNSVTFAGTDGTVFTLPSTTDTLVGRSSSDTLFNKVIAAGSNTISGLTNANLSGSAGIANANLANSGLSLNGNSGSGTVALGGALTLAGGGIASVVASGSTLTVTANEMDTLASVTARGAATSANITFTGGLTFSGSVTFSGTTNCRTLSTNASGALQCGDTSGDAAAFTDTSPATLTDNDTTELFNDAAKPHITPTVTSQAILVSAHARFTGGGFSDTDAAVRIVRNIGSAASCSTGTQVGDSFSAFLTNTTDIQTGSDTFLDSPATTSPVYYTVCSSANSVLGSNPSTNRIDVTLVRIGR